MFLIIWRSLWKIKTFVWNNSTGDTKIHFCLLQSPLERWTVHCHCVLQGFRSLLFFIGSIGDEVAQGRHELEEAALDALMAFDPDVSLRLAPIGWILVHVSWSSHSSRAYALCYGFFSLFHLFDMVRWGVKNRFMSFYFLLLLCYRCAGSNPSLDYIVRKAIAGRPEDLAVKGEVVRIGTITHTCPEQE